jgi:preprotein translocase subunit SecG
MLYVLYIIFFVSCVVLIAAVLLQPGKTDAGALFTSNVSSAAFGPRGTASVLSKLTIVASILFMLSALMISMPALTGNVSVLSGNETGVEEPAEQPAVEQQTEPANTNLLTDNSNGALIQTPATNSFEAQAANAATDPPPPANANAAANN